MDASEHLSFHTNVPGSMSARGSKKRAVARDGDDDGADAVPVADDPVADSDDATDNETDVEGAMAKATGKGADDDDDTDVEAAAGAGRARDDDGDTDNDGGDDAGASAGIVVSKKRGAPAKGARGSAIVSLGRRLKPVGSGHVAGMLVRVECCNFMCHSRLELDFVSTQTREPLLPLTVVGALGRCAGA